MNDRERIVQLATVDQQPDPWTAEETAQARAIELTHTMLHNARQWVDGKIDSPRLIELNAPHWREVRKARLEELVRAELERVHTLCECRICRPSTGDTST